MKFKFLLFFLCLFFLQSCENVNINQSQKINKKIEKKYNNLGFALIYNEDLDIKKLDNRSLDIFQNSLKNKSFVKITNPLNNKSLIAEVKSNKVKFSSFYNSVITNRIAESLDLNLEEPYIEITLISKNSTFVAKKSTTFEEEKNVAEKAPIDGILINDLSNKKPKKNKNKKKQIFSYSIKVADFYYEETAQLMIDRIKTKTSVKKYKIVKLSNTNYRVLIGPFNDINSLKKSFEKMKSLYFDNLEIIKNV